MVGLLGAEEWRLHDQVSVDGEEDLVGSCSGSWSKASGCIVSVALAAVMLW